MSQPGTEAQAILSDELLSRSTLTHSLTPDAGNELPPNPGDTPPIHIEGSLPPEAGAEAGTGPKPAPSRVLDDHGQDLLFREARTAWAWTDRPVDDATVRALYDLAKWGPTSANSSPARFMVLRSAEAKARLRWTLSDGNTEKCLAAPAVIIVAHDPRFYDDLPRLYPQADARTWFANNEDLATATAFRNGSLQGAYMLIAARALGLDAAPMSGFDNARVDSEFFLATGWKSNFLLAIGHADTTRTPPRNPRLTFDEACRLL